MRQDVNVALTPSWAPVTINSEPPGADVVVDGRNLGTTPAVLELTAGDREIVVSRAGYNPWRREIRVVADEPQELPPAVLTLADGRIEVATTPNDASVNVNGEYRGRTPIELRLPPNVEYRVTVQKPGYETVTRELRPSPGSRQALAFELEPQLGAVVVASEPAGAEVFINEERAGVTPLEVDLMAVDQSIAVRLSGFAEARQSITPRPGYPQRLEFALERLDEATGSGYPRTITASSGLNFRLVPAGGLMMGAPRGQGRLNETQRQVEISRAFYVGVTEVTNAQYRAFKPNHDSGTFGGMTLNDDDQPVVNLRWAEAVEYANWLSIQDRLQPVYVEENGQWVPAQPIRNGYRLLTEAEWAWAARAAGRDGAEPLVYAWGDELPPPDRSDNLADLTAADIMQPTLVFYTDGFPVSSPVATFAPNAMGLYDIGGNVSEWVQDIYDPLPEPPTEVQVDPLGPATGRLHVVRGPNWHSATERELRLSYRDYEDDIRETIGFRLARNLE